MLLSWKPVELVPATQRANVSPWQQHDLAEPPCGSFDERYKFFSSSYFNENERYKDTSSFCAQCDKPVLSLCGGYIIYLTCLYGTNHKIESLTVWGHSKKLHSLMEVSYHSYSGSHCNCDSNLSTKIDGSPHMDEIQTKAVFLPLWFFIGCYSM